MGLSMNRRGRAWLAASLLAVLNLGLALALVYLHSPWAKHLVEAGLAGGVAWPFCQLWLLKKAAPRIESHFWDFIEGEDGVVWVADPVSRRFRFISPKIEAVLGYPLERWLSEPDFHTHVIHSEDRESTVTQCNETLARGRECKLEYRAVTARGNLVWLLNRFHVIRDARGRPELLFGVMVDVSGRRQLEEQLRQSQKMEAVGRLAGGVAHDFNNLLTVVGGYADLVLARLAESDPQRRDLEQIKKAGERGAALTRQLLAFSRGQMTERRVLELDPIVVNIEPMLARLIGEDVDFKIQCHATGRVKADTGEIEQVLMNLAANARDAMPSGGTLRIETADVALDEAMANRAGAKPGRYVALSVTDNGCGMDPETRRRIFEPFFTTKELGKGTGLGLATVYAIVRDSGGHIDVTSEPGRGTAFRIYLPCIEVAMEPEHSEAPAEPDQGLETLLVVEDDDRVRSLVRAALGSHGYRVLEARCGEDALRMAEQHAGPIHLLLADVVLPEMSGPELAERLSRCRPEMKVLHMSGYPEQSVMRHALVGTDATYLEKPFRPKVLLQKVRELLDAPAVMRPESHVVATPVPSA